jgi:ABC-type sugar transport system permease subunit
LHLSKMRDRREESLWGVAFLAPGLFFFVAFLLFPIFYGLFVSFFRWDLINPMQYVAFGNYYRFVLEDPKTGRIAVNTLVFLVEVVPLSVFLPLIIAVLLSRTGGLKTVYQPIYFLPLISSNVAVALVWRWIFSKNFGLLNSILLHVSQKRIDWLGDQHFALACISLIVVWKTLPLNIILMIAAVRDTPRELYESATLDGCGELPTFRYITFPMVSSTTFFVLVLTLITCFFNGFDIIRVLTQGGPIDSTNIYVYYLYENAFLNQRMGYASAISFIFFIFILIVTLLQFRLQRRWVHY